MDLTTNTTRTTSALLPAFTPLPVEVERGEGVWLHTADGRRLLDFYAGHAVALLGYGHPRVVATLAAQARTLFFQTTAVQLAVRERAARALAALLPDGIDRVFFVNSGAEANENALRLAFRHTGRQRAVALQGAFHGRTAAAAAVTDGAKWYGFPQAPFAVTRVPRGDVGALEQALGDDVAALILEPVQGMAGAVDLGADYLRAARRLTAERGVVLVFDEVQCGMGRTGETFAARLHGVVPDVLTVAKGLAAGFPAGAVAVGEEIAAGVRSGDLGTTFGGGPLACALVAEVCEIVGEPGFLAHVRAMSERLRAACRVGPVVDVQGEGLLLGLRTSRPAAAIQADLLRRGVLVGTSADSHVVRLLPPLIVGEEHVDRLAAALAEVPA